MRTIAMSLVEIDDGGIKRIRRIDVALPTARPSNATGWFSQILMRGPPAVDRRPFLAGAVRHFIARVGGDGATGAAQRSTVRAIDLKPAALSDTLSATI
jgi:hypothetical protein